MKRRMLYLLLAAGVALSFLARFYDQFPGDVYLTHLVQNWSDPATTAFMKTVSHIGEAWFLIGLLGILALCLWLLGRRRECYLTLGALALMGLGPLLKLLIDRPRPPAEVVGVTQHFDGLGFPSGHAFQSLLLLGVLIYLSSVLVDKIWLRRSVQVFLAVLILAIGLSRVYLGAHWPSDVLGGYLIGAFFLALLLRGHRARSIIGASP